MSAKAILPNLAERDDAYPAIVQNVLPVGISGLVIAAALAAIMSTSSGALIATATVAKEDIVATFRRRQHPVATPVEEGGEHLTPTQEHDEVSGSRWYILGFGLLTILLACVISDVIAALTIAYDILVGGLLVAIIGGMVWKRGTIKGALVSIAAGVVVTLGTMVVVGDIYANEPIYAGLVAGLVAFVAVSLATPPTPESIRAEWDRRVNHRRSIATDTAATITEA
jgi:SSS family solute:Na+ symporter